MSSKKSKSKSSRPKVMVMAPEGMVPSAMVESRHMGEMIMRAGRGFSVVELEEAKVPSGFWRKWKVPTDGMRRSKLDDNVKALQKWMATAPKPAPVEPKEEPAEKPSKPVKKSTRKKKEN